MFNRTDRDHLGKLITYMAGLDARYAVLLASEFRDEHRAALNWLNTISTNDFGFFGIALEVRHNGGFVFCPPVARRHSARQMELFHQSIACLRFDRNIMGISAILGCISAQTPQRLSRLDTRLMYHQNCPGWHFRPHGPTPCTMVLHSGKTDSEWGRKLIPVKKNRRKRYSISCMRNGRR